MCGIIIRIFFYSYMTGAEWMGGLYQSTLRTVFQLQETQTGQYAGSSAG